MLLDLYQEAVQSCKEIEEGIKRISPDFFGNGSKYPDITEALLDGTETLSDISKDNFANQAIEGNNKDKEETEEKEETAIQFFSA